MTRRAILAALAGGVLGAKVRTIHPARVEPLWESPDGHPNALEATEEGLWVGEQVTDMAYLLDWKSGKVLKKVETESSNTSGIAYGGGFLWMAANGPASRRKPRPTDTKTGEVHKGVHGLCWGENSLWVTTLHIGKLTQFDVNFKELHSFPITLDRAHGIAWDRDSVWCLFSNDYLIQRLDAKDGHVREVIQLRKGTDPDPHGMTMHRGVFYYSDSAFVRGGGDHGGKHGGYICRIHL
jgi:hypothetical protein